MKFTIERRFNYPKALTKASCIDCMTDLASLADSSNESIDFMLSIIERHYRENLSHRISLLVQEALPTPREIRGQ